MNGIENPISEQVSSNLESNSVDLLVPLEQLSNLAEPNMKLLESTESPEPLILEPKSPGVDPKLKPLTVDTKSPSKSPKSKTAVPRVSSARTPSTPPKTTLSSNKSPGGTRAPTGTAKTPVKTAERPPSSKVSPAAGKVGVSTVTRITVQKDTVSGVSKSTPKSTIPAKTQVAPKTTTLTKKPPKPIETEKSTDPKTTVPVKTRPTTAPSNSRLTATKNGVKNESKVGDEPGKIGTETTKQRPVTSSARSAIPKDTTGVSKPTLTQRPATARPPRPQTATLTSTRPATGGVTKSSGVSAPKPAVVSKTAAPTRVAASKAPVTQPLPTKTQSTKPGVGKPTSASQPRKLASTTSTSSQPPPSKPQSRAPIKKPLGIDKKDVKINGTADTGKSSKIEPRVNDVQVNGVDVEKVVNGAAVEVEKIESSVVTKAENMSNDVKEDQHINTGVSTLEGELVDNLLLNDSSAQGVAANSLEVGNVIDLDVPLVGEVQHDKTAEIIQTDTEKVTDHQDPLVVAQDEIEEQIMSVDQPLDLTSSFEVASCLSNDLFEPEKVQFEAEAPLESALSETMEEVHDSLLTKTVSIPCEQTTPEVVDEEVVTVEENEIEEPHVFSEVKSEESVEPTNVVVLEDDKPTDDIISTITDDHCTNFPDEDVTYQISSSELNAQVLTTINDILDQQEAHDDESKPPLDFNEYNKMEEPEIYRDEESMSPIMNQENKNQIIFEDSGLSSGPQDNGEEAQTDYFCSSSPPPSTTEISSQPEEVHTQEEVEVEKVEFVVPKNEELLMAPESDSSSQQLASSSFEEMMNLEQQEDNLIQSTEAVQNTPIEVTDHFEDFKTIQSESENPFAVQDQLAEKSDITFERDIVNEEDSISQPRNPFMDEQLIDPTYNTGYSEDFNKNPFGTDNMFSADTVVLNNQENDPFSNSYGGGGVELENPFCDEKNLFGIGTIENKEFSQEHELIPPITTTEGQPQHHDEFAQFAEFGYGQAVTDRHPFDNFDEPTDVSRKEEGMSTFNLMEEINSNIVNPKPNGVGKEVLDCVGGDLEESGRLEDKERNTPDFIDTKVVLENSSSEIQKDVCKGLDFSSTPQDIPKESSLSESAYDPTF